MVRHLEIAVYLLLLLVIFLPASGRAEFEIGVPHDVDRLANGNTLITDGGSLFPARGSRVIEVSPEGVLKAAWLLDLDFAHNADPTGTGGVFVSDTGNDRVVEVDDSGAILWNSDDHSPLSDGSSLRYPNDANLLPSGAIVITDRDNHRIIEIDRYGNILWQFGVTGVPGGDSTHLDGPHNADRLAGGNTLVADSNNDRILEIDPTGVVVWQYSPAGPEALRWPRDADRLDSGNTLITDTANSRIIEVDPGGTVVWELAGVVGLPYDADRLADGNTLVSDSDGSRVVEVDSSGSVVWEYPGTVATVYDEVWIHNPTSGVDLFTHVHKPADAGPDKRYPAFVFVPGGSGAGQHYHFEAEQKAAEGFVVVHFDPDGRGSSTNGGTYTVEDYCGYLQQDGLHAVLEYVAALPEVDYNNIGVLSGSYGITMASGALARYQDDPPVRYLIDNEGPADRNDTASVNGGHVPVDPSNNAFWAEREAATFMPDVLARYVRIQTEVDHNPNITDNHHAVMLNNAATHTAFGGSGISPWTRVNRDFENSPNQTYTIADPALWIPESQSGHSHVLDTLLLLECAAAPTMTVSGDLTPGGTAGFAIGLGEAMDGQPFRFAVSFGDGPTVIPGVTTIHLDIDRLVSMTLQQDVLDSSGSAVVSVPIPAGSGIINTYYAQAVYRHPGAATGYSATTGVAFEVANP